MRKVSGACDGRQNVTPIWLRRRFQFTSWGERHTEATSFRDSQLRREVFDQASDLVRSLELGEMA